MSPTQNESNESEFYVHLNSPSYTFYWVILPVAKLVSLLNLELLDYLQFKIYVSNQLRDFSNKSSELKWQRKENKDYMLRLKSTVYENSDFKPTQNLLSLHLRLECNFYRNRLTFGRLRVNWLKETNFKSGITYILITVATIQKLMYVNDKQRFLSVQKSFSSLQDRVIINNICKYNIMRKSSYDDHHRLIQIILPRVEVHFLISKQF